MLDKIAATLLAVLIFAVTPTAAPVTVARAEDSVDLLLVLAADVSRSVDAVKFQLQREGYAAALTSPRVIRAIQSGLQGRIAISFVEWSGAGAQAVMVDWTAIGSLAEAEAFVQRLLAAPRLFMERTAIGAAIDFSVLQLARSPYKGLRRVIDVSGDGTSNSGRDVVDARNAAVAQGITVNGLAILSAVPLAFNPQHTHPPGGLLKYYEDNIIGGPGAFALAAESHEHFGQHIASKLIKEIAMLGPGVGSRE
jgi:Protein of unknown function (DUF1194)